MSQILKTYKFLRCASAVQRPAFQCSRGKIKLCLPKESAPATFNCLRYFTTNPELLPENKSTIVAKTSFVSISDVKPLIEQVKSRKNLNGSQLLSLLRCCGDTLIDEIPREKVAMADDLFNFAKQLGIPLDISHYNALFKVYVENKHDFSPAQFWSNLTEANIEPNRVTLQLFIAKYCQTGEMKEATKILEFMKEKNMPINDHVFNSFILGHCEAGNFASAEEIRSIMKNSGLEETASTKEILLAGYAKIGNLEKIDEILDECSKKEVFLPDNVYINVIYILAKNGHLEHIRKIFKCVKNQKKHRELLTIVICRILSDHDLAAGVQLFHSLLKGLPIDALAASDLQAVFLDKTVRSGHSLISVWEAFKKFSGCEGLKFDLLSVSRICVEKGNLEECFQVFNLLKQEHLPVRIHYFWPLLIKACKSSNKEDLLAILKEINRLEVHIDSSTAGTYFLPHLPEDELKKYLLGPVLERARVLYSSVEDSEDNLLQKVKDNPRGISLLSKAKIAALLKSDEDFVKVLEIFVAYASGHSNYEHNWNECIRFCVRKIDLLNLKVASFLQALKALNMIITKESAVMIDRKYNLQPELKNLLNEVTRSGSDVEKMIIQKRNEWQKLNARDTTGVERRRRQPSYGEEEDYLHVLAANQQYEHILDAYYKLRERKPDHKLRLESLFIVSNALAFANKTEEAINLIKSFGAEVLHVKEGKSKWREFVGIVMARDRQAYKRILKILSNLKAYHVLDPSVVILHLLNRNDLEGAVEAYQRWQQAFKEAPFTDTLMRVLIEKENPELLQKVTNIYKEKKGPQASLAHLIYNLILCGRPIQAATVIEALPNIDDFDQIAKYLLQNIDLNQSLLENLLEAVKPFASINKTPIFYQLLQSFIKTNDVDKASDLWTRMQEEDCIPDERFLATLGNFLKSSGREVPFQIPDVDLVEPPQDTYSSRHGRGEKYFIHMTRAVDEALIRFKNKENIPTQEIKDIIALLRKRQDVDTLLKMENMIFESSHHFIRHRYAMALCESCILTNKCELYIQHLRRWHEFAQGSNNWTVRTSPQICKLLKMHPRFIPEVEDLGVKFFENNSPLLLNDFWTFCLTNSDFEDKAKELFEKYFQNSPDLKINYALNEAFQSKNENLARKLIEFTRNCNVETKLQAYNNLLAILSNKDKYEEALGVLENVPEDMFLNQIDKNILRTIKEGLESQGKSFPFPMFENNANEDGSSKNGERVEIST